MQNTITTYRLKIDQTHAGKRLDQALFDWLGADQTLSSKAQARKVIVAGGTYLNRKRCRIASKTLIDGASIEVHLRKNGVQKTHKKFDFDPNWIVFEDNDFLILNKPSGLPTQPTLDRARNNIFELAKKYLESKKHPYLALHHRLDAGTSGLILFCKNKSFNKSISDQFQNHEVQKTYIAKSHVKTDRDEKEFVVENFLGFNQPHSKKKKVQAVQSGGKKAITECKILKRTGDSVKIRARPKTGRMHQIRVHLADQGYPIWGDTLYGQSKSSKRLFLHAEKLKLKHPKSNEWIEFIARCDF